VKKQKDDAERVGRHRNMRRVLKSNRTRRERPAVLRIFVETKETENWGIAQPQGTSYPCPCGIETCGVVCYEVNR